MPQKLLFSFFCRCMCIVRDNRIIRRRQFSHMQFFLMKINNRLNSNNHHSPIMAVFFFFILFFLILCFLSVFLPEQRAHCAICTDRIWGLGRQGYKCINCKLLVHKKCHKLVTVECGRPMIQVRAVTNVMIIRSML